MGQRATNKEWNKIKCVKYNDKKPPLFRGYKITNKDSDFNNICKTSLFEIYGFRWEKNA